MYKRGSAGDNELTWNVAYLILGIVFFAGVLWFIVAHQDGVSFLEDFYAKELARIVNNAQPGDEVYLDVTNVVPLAIKNGRALSDIFQFDNVNNAVIVSIGKHSSAKFNYFNNVDVIFLGLDTPSGTAETDRLHFKISEAQK